MTSPYVYAKDTSSSSSSDNIEEMLNQAAAVAFPPSQQQPVQATMPAQNPCGYNSNQIVQPMVHPMAQPSTCNIQQPSTCNMQQPSSCNTQQPSSTCNIQAYSNTSCGGGGGGSSSWMGAQMQDIPMGGGKNFVSGEDFHGGEMVTVNGETGFLVNRKDIMNFCGPVPISEYPINDDPHPEVIRKRTNTHLTYTQEVSIRYLRPPTPPPPGDIIIRQDRSVVPPVAPPIVIRQQAPRPETPPPLVIREQPPKAPAPIPSKLIIVPGKKIPPPPRKVIIERLAPLPAKPQAIIVERWLAFREQRRRVIFQKQTEPEMVYEKPRNVIVQWDAPKVRVTREVKDLGVVRANPDEYFAKYGPSLKNVMDMPDFVREIKAPKGLMFACDVKNYKPELEGDYFALAMVDLEREGLSEYRSYVEMGGNVYFNKGGGHTQLFSEVVTQGKNESSLSSEQPQQQVNNYHESSSRNRRSPVQHVNERGRERSERNERNERSERNERNEREPNERGRRERDISPSVRHQNVSFSNNSNPCYDTRSTPMVVNTEVQAVLKQLVDGFKFKTRERVTYSEGRQLVRLLNEKLGRNFDENQTDRFFESINFRKEETMSVDAFTSLLLNSM